MEQLVARKAHNLEVVRSSRAPATKRKTGLKSSQFVKTGLKSGQSFEEL